MVWIWTWNIEEGAAVGLTSYFFLCLPSGVGRTVGFNTSDDTGLGFSGQEGQGAFPCGRGKIINKLGVAALDPDQRINDA
jgi:hypothetical protein